MGEINNAQKQFDQITNELERLKNYRVTLIKTLNNYLINNKNILINDKNEKDVPKKVIII
jgi:hypothetical protein